MKRLGLLLFALSSCWAQDTAKIDSVGLFKNGLSVVRIADSIPESGILDITAIPDPVHGTFWIESKNPVSARIALTSIEAPLMSVSQPELLQHLIGQHIKLQLDEDTIEGVILGETWEQRKQWDRNYAHVNGQPAWNYWARNDSSQSPNPQAQLTFIRTESGMVALQPGEVKRVVFTEMPKIKREQPVLRLESAGGGAVGVEYLTKGLSWAPSYRVDISDPKTLMIEQKAVIRNELTDLRNVEFRLISGFPSVRFAGVDSPLSTRQTWTNFFQQVLNAGQQNNNMQGQMLTQNRIFENNSGGGGGAGAGAALGPADAGEGEGVDLHYQSVGRHSLAPGESISLDVAESNAKYERVVEWNIPDTRHPNGRYVQEHERQQDPDKFDESAWDAIVFNNPFEFPMTTAAAMLVHQGKFQGQQLAHWTNPGDQISIRITKALSVSTRAVENEIPDTREALRIASDNFYKVQVQGELTVKNHRGKPAVLTVKRRFSGELLEADDEPSEQLLEAGIYSINTRNELRWRLELPAGEEKVIKYRYEVLVDN